MYVNVYLDDAQELLVLMSQDLLPVLALAIYIMAGRTSYTGYMFPISLFPSSFAICYIIYYLNFFSNIYYFRFEGGASHVNFGKSSEKHFYLNFE